MFASRETQNDVCVGFVGSKSNDFEKVSKDDKEYFDKLRNAPFSNDFFF